MAEPTEFHSDPSSEAAHGGPVDVLGRDPLLEYVDFIKALCEAIVELVTWHALDKGPISGTSRLIGKCTKHYSKAFIAVVEGAKVQVGDPLYFRGKGYCYPGQTLSLQLNNVDQQTMEVVKATEVGFRCEPMPQKFAEIHQVVEVAVEAAPPEPTAEAA